MKTAIANDVKMNNVIVALTDITLKNRELAEQFGCSEAAIARAKKAFVENVRAQAAAAAEKATKKATAPAAKDATPAPASTVDVNDNRGFRPRNGRMNIIRQAINELGGAKADPSAVYDRVCELSKKAKLHPIKRTAVYVLMREEIAKLHT